jgi:hypothetical protein
MSKVVRYTLAFENEYDYKLVGICTHVSDYKLVWSMNEKLGFHLEKALDLFLVNNKKGQLGSSHPYYFMYDEDKRLELYLIKNKHEGKQLIPEKQQIDYFLFICNNVLFDLDEWVEKLRETSNVMAAYLLEPTDFNSTQYIVFD